MVESSIWRTAGPVNLIPQGLCCSFVDLVATRDIVHVQESVSETDVIDRVTVIVKQDIAIEARVEHDIGMLFNVRSVLVLVSAIIGELYAGQQRRDIVCVRWADAVLDLAVRHPGQIARLSVERAW